MGAPAPASITGLGGRAALPPAELLDGALFEFAHAVASAATVSDRSIARIMPRSWPL
jgi:hypothetical protein